MDTEDKKLYFETIQKIEDANQLEECLKDPKWEVIRRMFDATRDDAAAKLQGEPLDTPESVKRAMRWQLMIDQWDNVLPQLIQRYRDIGKSAYELAQEKNWINRITKFFEQV